MKNIKIVDANIILRYLLADDLKFFNLSKDIIENSKILIKEVVLAEVVYVLEKVYEVNRKEIAETLKKLISLKNIEMENRKFILKALNIYIKIKN